MIKFKDNSGKYHCFNIEKFSGDLFRVIYNYFVLENHKEFFRRFPEEDEYYFDNFDICYFVLKVDHKKISKNSFHVDILDSDRVVFRVQFNYNYPVLLENHLTEDFIKRSMKIFP